MSFLIEGGPSTWLVLGASVVAWGFAIATLRAWRSADEHEHWGRLPLGTIVAALIALAIGVAGTAIGYWRGLRAVRSAEADVRQVMLSRVIEASMIPVTTSLVLCTIPLLIGVVAAVAAWMRKARG